MGRRVAIAAAVTAIALAAPACRFSGGGDDDDAAATSTSAVTVFALGEQETTTTAETTTTIGVSATTARRAPVPARAATATTRAPVAAPRAPATTRAPASPHCNASAADAFYGSTWTVNVSSTFPSSPVTIDLKWPGGSGNYSGYTDGAGSWSKTQRVQPSMRGQRVSVTVTVGTVRCATSFAAS